MDKELEKELVGDVIGALQQNHNDIAVRNAYIQTRHSNIYGSGLWDGLQIPLDNDKTFFNFLRRTVDILVSQLMGRPFQVYSKFYKEDISALTDEQEISLAELRNKKRAADADSRKRMVDAIIKDNGGTAVFKLAAKIASAYGTLPVKMWWDQDEKKIKFQIIEKVQNYRVGWGNDNFRERDWDAFGYQISKSKANRDFGKYLEDGETFELSIEGSLLEPLLSATRNDRPMVDVIDFTGYLDGWCMDGEYPSKCDDGDESKLSLMIVGRHLVQSIKNESLMPNYYMIRNEEDPQEPWGRSDITDTAISINKTYLDQSSIYFTMFGKIIAPMYLGINFDQTNVPKKNGRKVTVVPNVVPEQDLKLVETPNATGYEFKQVFDMLENNYVREVGIGRVLWDDPTINANSNQALMTTLKGVVDKIAGKQARWETQLVQMFEDALKIAAKNNKDIKAVVETDEPWYMCIEWPSILRQEDAQYQTMWLNLFNAGVVSWETYLEKIGMYDTGDEMNRVRDEMKDPTSAAVKGRQLGTMASQTLNKALGIPPWGYVVPKVQLRGDLTPDQEANMAQNYGWQDGPFGSSVGPQGAQGTAANDNFINAGQINGNPFDGGMPVGAHPGGQPANPQAANPQLTADQNQGQSVSQPGSGQPAVSAAGAAAQANQNAGR
jgi:hypothetical protein